MVAGIFAIIGNLMIIVVLGWQPPTIYREMTSPVNKDASGEMCYVTQISLFEAQW